MRWFRRQKGPPGVSITDERWGPETITPLPAAGWRISVDPAGQARWAADRAAALSTQRLESRQRTAPGNAPATRDGERICASFYGWIWLIERDDGPWLLLVADPEERPDVMVAFDLDGELSERAAVILSNNIG